MRLEDLQFDLPPELIAQRPVEPRDASRLLVLERGESAAEPATLAHAQFRDILAYLRPHDCLVLNNTRVVPARFYARRASGGRVEGLFLREDDGEWLAMLKPSARLRVGETLHAFSPASDNALTIQLRLTAAIGEGEWRIQPLRNGAPLLAGETMTLLAEIGHTPLPPYIRGGVGDAADVERYQTVYAQAAGAVAAPTAGLHFTPELLDALAADGVRRAEVTLHVGAGTFAPIKVEDISKHPMHAEWFEIKAAALEAIRAARAVGGRVVAVGTTSARVLESIPRVTSDDSAEPRSGWTDIFIRPEYSFRNVDALITNFHLPGSTLIALVMALAGAENIRRAYAEAIERRYRFYSYGDAMLIV
ncbi:MAG: tRNA preQ1(34) S-adenosylmethionine ribosyltransferase-isomerase QueA [Phycisphaerales bacterium]|nr:tRNA preQ1(34) S-adenosylmethionine ribosyltransferase-isomerase QueA [Phycisphaerales bacterium]